MFFGASLFTAFAVSLYAETAVVVIAVTQVLPSVDLHLVIAKSGSSHVASFVHEQTVTFVIPYADVDGDYAVICDHSMQCVSVLVDLPKQSIEWPFRLNAGILLKQQADNSASEVGLDNVIPWGWVGLLVGMIVGAVVQRWSHRSRNVSSHRGVSEQHVSDAATETETPTDTLKQKVDEFKRNAKPFSVLWLEE
jgi:hypothetical protein